MKTFKQFLVEHDALESFEKEVKNQLISIGINNPEFLEFRINYYMELKEMDVVAGGFLWDLTEQGWKHWDTINSEWNDSLVLHSMVDLHD